MECREILENSSGYIDGELAPSAAAPFREHIERCTSCAEALRSLEETSGTVAESLESIELRPEVWRRIESRIAEFPAGDRRRGLWFRLFQPSLRLAAAAALVVLALVSGTLTVVLQRRSEAELQAYMDRYIQSRRAAAEVEPLEDPPWWRSPYSAMRSGGTPENPFLDVDYSRPIVNPFEAEGK